MPAKMTHMTLTQSEGLTRYTFEIMGEHFRYQWKFSPRRHQLDITVENVILSASLPKLPATAKRVKSYQVKPLRKTSVLQFKFQLQDKVDVAVHRQPLSQAHKTALIVDVKTQDNNAKKQIQKTAVVKALQPSSTAQSAVQKESVSAAPAQKEPILKKTDRSIMVVIDPGHGGKDVGAVGSDHTREKDIVLAISKILQKNFRKHPAFDAELTRSRDIFIPLRARLDIARRCKADIFIAIHADAAYQNEDVVGASVFALSERGATSEGARWLAKKENESELMHGLFVNKDQMLRSVLLDLSQTHTISVSLEMGKAILSKLSHITALHYPRVEQAAFVVLKSPDMPSLLVETGYISNPTQEKKLKDPAYQQQLANAIVEGVAAYFAAHPHRQI